MQRFDIYPRSILNAFKEELENDEDLSPNLRTLSLLDATTSLSA